MKTEELRREEGQAAVLITLLIMFAFIALTALAIDGGHLYVERRDLQNMADAACLAAATELSLDGTAQEAYDAAVASILDNGGSLELYSPKVGTGVDLVKGIEVSGADVRVALQRLVDTYFTMIFNRTGALVGAGAHCNATAAGGLLPIAVRRFEYNKDAMKQRDFLANKTSDPARGGPGYPGDSLPVTWPGRYGDMTVFLPISPTFAVSDGALTDDWTGTIDCDVPPGDNVSEGVCVLSGGGPKNMVGTNDGTADYKGFVLLDARNIVPGPVEYWNGATGQANTNKAISKQWFHTGYYGPNPMVGDQLAMLDGTSNDFAAQEMALYYEVGDEFVAVVYSGYIWDIPDLKMSIEPVERWISPIITGTTQTVTYTVTLEKVGPKPWDGDANFALQASFMEVGGEYGVISPTVNFSPNPWVILLQGENSKSVAMTVSAFITDTNFLSKYLSALTVRARETTGVGLKRWASTNFRYGNIGSDFTLYAEALEYNLPQGDSLAIPLTTRGFGCAQNKADLNASVEVGTWGDVFTSNPADNIKILDGKDSNSTFTLKAKDSAGVGTYPVLLEVGPACGQTHSVRILVNVYKPSPGGTPKRFVIVEGFAPFRVSYKDANTIGAYAIGPIVEHVEDLISGLNPRLLPWRTP